MPLKNYSEVLKNSKIAFSAMENGTFALEYVAALKKTAKQFSALAGNNYSFTPAIPAIIQGRKYEIYFAYRIGRDKKILRPYLKVVADYITGNIVEYRNAAYSDFADSVKYPLEKIFDASVPLAETAHEQMALLKKLQMKYEKVREFAFKKDLLNEELDILACYVKALKETIPNGLLKFCVDTEPQFFEWLQSVTFVNFIN